MVVFTIFEENSIHFTCVVEILNIKTFLIHQENNFLVSFKLKVLPAIKVVINRE